MGKKSKREVEFSFRYHSSKENKDDESNNKDVSYIIEFLSFLASIPDLGNFLGAFILFISNLVRKLIS